ncbi:hypothetical protein CF326_g4482 [Tilletia indica]
MSFGELPAEIQLKIGSSIVDNAFNGDNSGADAFLAGVRDVEAVATMNKRMAAIMHRCTEKRFDGITPWRHYAVRAHLTHWIPIDGDDHADHDTYWFVHLGHTWPQTSEIKPLIKWFDKSGAREAIWIRADIRVRDSNTHGGSRGDAEAWQDAVEFLSRIPAPNPALKILHLIFSASQAVVDSIANILRKVPQLTEIVLICDTAIELLDVNYPILNLDEIYLDNEEGAQLDRFLIRAPVLRVVSDKPGAFFKRLGKAHTICLAVHRILPAIQTWEWTLDLLNAAPNVRAFEISESQPWDPIQYFNSAPQQNRHVKVVLPHLIHLTLSSHHWDGQFFTRLDAPTLKYLRVRSVKRIGKAGYCDKNHFPSLMVASIWCAGPVIERFEAIGLGRSQFLHNITRGLWTILDHDKEVLAYLKNYDPDIDSFYDNYPPAHMMLDHFSDVDTMSITSAEDSSAEEAGTGVEEPEDAGTGVEEPEDAGNGEAGDDHQEVVSGDDDDASSTSSLTSLGTTSEEDNDGEGTGPDTDDIDDFMEDSIDDFMEDDIASDEGPQEPPTLSTCVHGGHGPLNASTHAPAEDEGTSEDEVNAAICWNSAASTTCIWPASGSSSTHYTTGVDSEAQSRVPREVQEMYMAAGLTAEGLHTRAHESKTLALSSGDEDDEEDDVMQEG